MIKSFAPIDVSTTGDNPKGKHEEPKGKHEAKLPKGVLPGSIPENV